MFVIARNNYGRPTLIHRLDGYSSDRTSCGVQMVGWSREYMHKPIWETLRCKKKGCR